MRKALPYLVLLGLVALGACSSNPTGPSPLPERTTTTAPAPSGDSTPQTVAPTEPTGPNRLVEVSCNGAGDCTFTNLTDTEKPVDAVCTRVGQHNDWGSWAGKVPGSGTLDVSVYDICDPVKIGIDLCEGGEQKVQVDLRYGKSSIHIGQWGIAEGLKLTYEPNEQYCECEPGEWKDVEVVGEPFAGEQIECPVQRDVVEVCYKCFEKWVEVKQTDGCAERTIKRITDGIIREEVECQCEPEWTPGEPDISFEPTGDCGEYDDQDGCEQPGIFTKTTVYTNQCDDRTRTEKTTEEGFRACECNVSCEDFDPPDVTVDFEVLTHDSEGGTTANGFNCTANHNVPGLVVCAVPPSVITPALPFEIAFSQTQLFTFDWSGTFSPSDGLECPIRGQVTDEVTARDEPGLCYYRVSCGDQEPAAPAFTTSNSKECTDQQQQAICEAAVGQGGDNGIWRNFGDANLLNHCQFNHPGYVNNDFQLNPGQSAEGCLNKNDD